ncbi:MAG: YopX family protein [Bacteroidales bacterium]|nr:YopX family protein [Bacteroidales bacterium]
MNRDIKFRAWDKEDKKMYKVDIFNLSSKQVFIVNQKPLSKWKNYSKRGNVILMQYTGLKDKKGKGKEIYEGDLLKDPQGNIGEVFYLAPSFVIRWKRKNGSWDTDSCFGYGEIIGNIYESKHFLDNRWKHIYENPELSEELK